MFNELLLMLLKDMVTVNALFYWREYNLIATRTFSLSRVAKFADSISDEKKVNKLKHG
jgi:hypothetical protein